jgi:signal transduction histidine kinase
VAGTGIGLSVSREIAAAHGGTLTAEDIDDGASFKLCLPRD